MRDLHSHQAHPSLQEMVGHLGHFLPAQGPISVFIHHNTLHAFQQYPFEEAVIRASRVFGTQPYLSEERYRRHIEEGRILPADVDFVLDREEDVDIIPGEVTRRRLRRLMVLPGIRHFDAKTIEWQMEETDLLTRFRGGIDARKHHRLLAESAAFWAERMGHPAPQGPDRERVAVEALFSVCMRRVNPGPPSQPEDVVRSRSAEAVNSLLIVLCQAYLDQGVAYWPMPFRQEGFYRAVRKLIAQPGMILPTALIGIDRDFQRQMDMGLDAEAVVRNKLDAMGVEHSAWEQVLLRELLALPGWAGLMNRLEEEPQLAPHERLSCSLMDFLAVRLTLSTAAIHNLRATAEPAEMISNPKGERLLAPMRVFDMAQLLGISAPYLDRLNGAALRALIAEIEAFDDFERRRVLHLAYEHRHERQILSPLALHRRSSPPRKRTTRASAQIFFCIDDREESIRRALEETDPSIETFAAAGFFGVAIDYEGLDDAGGAAFCPVVVKPQHRVKEIPVAEHSALGKRRKKLRRAWARLSRGAMIGSRSLFRGWISTSILGLLSVFPLVGRVLAPRRLGMLREWFERGVFPEPKTELQMHRPMMEDKTEDLLPGFTIDEMADRVAGVLVPAGLVQGFAPIVLILGHGSTSLNNPFFSAYNCGACGGRAGEPNARLYAAMANVPEVREALISRGVRIPAETWFLGGCHDTCNDAVDIYDEDKAPESLRPSIATLRAVLDKARAMNAHERARRFEAANPADSPEQALRHVEERSEHIAEPRPELGHATNAVAIVGRRELTQGLFLDRRAFLISYDAALDPANDSLGRLLAAGGPVCAGINLEYYFSCVDNEKYGSGTKVPHNVTSLVGIMNGFASDLLTGLPSQMIEIHEPVRLLLIVETTPERLTEVVMKNPQLVELVMNRWIRSATVDPDTGAIHVLRPNGWEPLGEPDEPLPTAPTSRDWYAGQLDHLPLAQIQKGLPEVAGVSR